MAKSVIVVKKAGQIISGPYVSRLVKEFGRFMGTALVAEGELVVDHKKGKLTEDAVNEVQTAFKDYEIVFYFSDTEMMDEDQQPFEVVADKDTGTKVVVALEGKFEGYTVPKSTHTNEWHCKEDFISKKLPKLFRSANAGLPGLLEELKDPITQQDFSNSWTDRGFISFLTTAEPTISISNKGHVFKQSYAWGDTSNGLNHTEKVVGATTIIDTKAEAKPLSKFELLKLKVAGKPVPAIAADLPAPLKAETAIAAAASAVAGDVYEFVQLPQEAFDKDNRWTNDAKAKWWISEVGYKPDGFKDGKTKIKRTKGTKVGILAPLSAANVDDKKVDPKTLPDMKPVEAPAASTSDVAPKHVLTDNSPIITPRQKIKLHADWMKDAEVIKILGDDYQKMAHDPKRLKEFEDNCQTFYDGMGLSENVWFSFEALMRLGSQDIKALAVYAFNRQNDNVRNDLKVKSILLDPGKKIAHAM